MKLIYTRVDPDKSGWFMHLHWGWGSIAKWGKPLFSFEDTLHFETEDEFINFYKFIQDFNVLAQKYNKAVESAIRKTIYDQITECVEEFRASIPSDRINSYKSINKHRDVSRNIVSMYFLDSTGEKYSIKFPDEIFKIEKSSN